MHTELNTLALISEVTGMILFAAAWAAAAWAAGGIWLVGQLSRRSKHNDQ